MATGTARGRRPRVPRAIASRETLLFPLLSPLTHFSRRPSPPRTAGGGGRLAEGQEAPPHAGRMPRGRGRPPAGRMTRAGRPRPLPVRETSSPAGPWRAAYARGRWPIFGGGVWNLQAGAPLAASVGPRSGLCGSRPHPRRDGAGSPIGTGVTTAAFDPPGASSTASATSSSCSGPTASRRRTSARTWAASPPAPGGVQPTGEAVRAGFGQVGGQAVSETIDNGFPDIHG